MIDNAKSNILKYVEEALALSQTKGNEGLVNRTKIQHIRVDKGTLNVMELALLSFFNMCKFLMLNDIDFFNYHQSKT